jgi:hypothetical protein
MNLKKLLFPLYAYRQYKELWERLFNMEDALNWVINSPEYIASDGTGFNGQKFRKQIFEELLNVCDFKAILETGTYTGDTTGYFSKTSNLPVYTCEVNKWYHSIARKRLKDFPDVHFYLGDSRKFLLQAAANGLIDESIFVYLDAHWDTDLPLREEIKIISENWDNFVIMIDDFQVPDDSGYEYDYYTRRKSLRMKIFEDLFYQNKLIPFFPSASSELETGGKRGCVVLTREGENVLKLEKTKTLRRFETNGRF